MQEEMVPPQVRQAGQRPFGLYAIVLMLLLVAISAVLDIVRIRIGFPTRLLQQVAETFRDAVGVLGLTRRFQLADSVLIVIDIAVIAILLALAVSLWFRLRWAWVAAMVVIGIGLVYNIWNYLQDTPLYINMLLHVITVFYLNERSVQLAFERRAGNARKAA